ncbi:MAG: hypothetical protein JXR95_16570 [Deltaproteobacteria bacterium]|nr:hypothetical protein [Deltaproteobacteria bacterium]
MKLLSITILSILALPSISRAQTTWNSDTALVLEKGTLETGLFEYSHFGIGKGMEIGTHPLMFFVSPQVWIKKQWKKSKRLALSTKHGINIPTGLMKILSREGTGGIYPADSEIPIIFSHFHEGTISLKLPLKTLLSLTMEFSNSLQFGKSSFPTIDLPLIYTRTSHFYGKQVSFRAGMDIQGQLGKNFLWLIDFNLFYMPGYSNQKTMEHKGALRYSFCHMKYFFTAGYIYIHGEYPFGNQSHIIPFADFGMRFDL